MIYSSIVLQFSTCSISFPCSVILISSFTFHISLYYIYFLSYNFSYLTVVIKIGFPFLCNRDIIPSFDYFKTFYITSLISIQLFTPLSCRYRCYPSTVSFKNLSFLFLSYVLFVSLFNLVPLILRHFLVLIYSLLHICI